MHPKYYKGNQKCAKCGEKVFPNSTRHYRASKITKYCKKCSIKVEKERKKINSKRWRDKKKRGAELGT